MIARAPFGLSLVLLAISILRVHESGGVARS